MKFLKNTVIGILNFLLINLLMVLIISLNLKSIITDGIIKETIKQQITASTYQEALPKIKTDDERINQILESKEVQELLDKYLDATINGVIDEESINDIELEKDMLDYLRENKETLEKVIGVEITDEMIDKTEEQMESKELSKIFKQTISNTNKNLPEEAKVVLKGYNFLISTKFKIIVIILILVDLLLVALIQKSVYRWLKSLGISAIVSGIGILIMSIVVNLIVTKLTFLTSFNVSPLIISSIVLIVLGIFSIIVKIIIDKQITKKKEDEYEVPQVSE